MADTVQRLRDNPALGLLLFDIPLADGSSFDSCRQVAMGCPAFIPSYDEHALEAFQVNGIGYLLKPLKQAGCPV